MTLDLNSWGFRKNYELNDVIKIEKLIEEIVTTVSCGGNVLINVGPTSQGKSLEGNYTDFVLKANKINRNN